MAHPQLTGKAWADIIHHHRNTGQPCHLCGYPIRHDLPGTHRLGLSVDHLIPRIHGGTNTLSNTAPAHKLCNSARKHRDITPELRARCRLLVEVELGITTETPVAAWR